MTKPTATFLWLDLETTGLDPEADNILECAYIVTDRNLVELARDERVFAISPRGRERLESNPYVLNMHTSSGLLAECGRLPHSQYAIHQIGSFLRAAVDAFEWDGMEPADKADAKRLPILAGSTIRFDHGFLREDAPEFANDAVIHHRQLDITATMLLAKSVGVTFDKAEAHRAMADVLESLANARKCRDLFVDALKYHIETPRRHPGDSHAEDVLAAIGRS